MTFNQARKLLSTYTTYIYIYLNLFKINSQVPIY